MLSFTSFWFLCLYSLITQSGIDTLKTKGLNLNIPLFLGYVIKMRFQIYCKCILNIRNTVAFMFLHICTYICIYIFRYKYRYL